MIGLGSILKWRHCIYFPVACLSCRLWLRRKRENKFSNVRIEDKKDFFFFALLGKQQQNWTPLRAVWTIQTKKSIFKPAYNSLTLGLGLGSAVFFFRLFSPHCRAWFRPTWYSMSVLPFFQTLWSFMLSYHQIYKWHEQYDPAMHPSATGHEEPSAEAAYNKNYIQQKLDHGLNRIWKVCSL